MFFDRLKSGFFPGPIAIKFSPVIGYRNVVLSKIDITITTINKNL